MSIFKLPSEINSKTLSEITDLKTISLLLPTRQRPANMKSLWESVQKTSDYPKQLEIVFYIDNDDQESIDEVNRLNHDYPEQIKWIIGPRICLSEMWNKAYEKSTGNILMHSGDDILFRTDHWDTYIRLVFSKYSDRIVFVFGDDTAIHKNPFGTHGFLHRNWVKVIGYFVPPYFSSDYNDTWLNEVSGALGRKIYIPDIITEHMHYTLGKSEIDQNTLERLERHQKDKVENLYNSLKVKRIEDGRKLLKYILNNSKKKSPNYIKDIKK